MRDGVRRVDDSPCLGRSGRGELFRRSSDERRFAAILCDLMMPGMSGIELYERIQRDHPGLEARILFMSGGVAMLRASEFFKSVANPMFEKPFDLKELRQTLRRLVDAP